MIRRFLYITALVAGMFAAFAVCGGCQMDAGPYPLPNPDPIDPWVPPVPPIVVDPDDPFTPPVPDTTILKEDAEAAIGLDADGVTELLGPPWRETVTDGVEVWLYHLDAPPGATAEIRFRDGAVYEVAYW